MSLSGDQSLPVEGIAIQLTSSHTQGKKSMLCCSGHLRKDGRWSVGRRAPGRIRPGLCPEGSKGHDNARKKGSLPPSRLGLERAFEQMSPPHFSPW